jgi:multidrug resistance efflux pump
MSVEKDNQQPTSVEQERSLSDVDISSIEIRSEEVQEIMGYIPHWIIRSGITLLFIVVILFLIGSWFFKYPDVIPSTITVTTETPPAAITARISGKIQKLFVHDNQEVKADELIALIDNATDYNHLFALKEKLAALEKFSPPYDASGTIQFDENYSLGELQTNYTTFLKSYGDYRHFIQLDYHNKKIASTRQELDRQKVLYETTLRQTANMEEQYRVGKEQYRQAEEMFKAGVISKSEMGNAKNIFLQKEYSLEGARSSLENQKIQMARLEQTILDLQLQYREQKKQLELTLSGSYDNMVGRIAQWEQTYIVKTPISGVVTFTKYWSVNQNVSMGDTVVTVIPDDAGKMVGKVILPIQGSGKVKVGQHVNIKFYNYPYVEYGMVLGIIKSKSLVASDNNYIVEVELPDGMKTSYGEVLSFSQEMQGTAEIITEDIRLLERIFKPIKSMLDRM